MWRERPSGSRGAVGRTVGPEGGFSIADGLRFDQHVPPGGYLWWYIDALSADGTHGLTIILFVGSVFSPYYKWQRRKGEVNPENHCAVNVVLFGRGGKRWAMTERGAPSLHRSAREYSLGSSHASVTEQGVEIFIDEICVPFPTRLKGHVKVNFLATHHLGFHLDSSRNHVWRPIAPCSTVEVSFSSPQQSWSGYAYVDSNWGAEPVEARFEGWQWSRAEHGSKTCVYYDVNERDGSARSIACAFDQHGGVSALPQAELNHAAKTGWLMPRPYRSEPGGKGLIKTVEDTPFYARSLMGQVIEGEPVTAIHESLSVTRFASPAVQMMLPWRMPRRNLAPR